MANSPQNSRINFCPRPSNTTKTSFSSKWPRYLKTCSSKYLNSSHLLRRFPTAPVQARSNRGNLWAGITRLVSRIALCAPPPNGKHTSSNLTAIKESYISPPSPKRINIVVRTILIVFSRPMLRYRKQLIPWQFPSFARN